MKSRVTAVAAIVGAVVVALIVLFATAGGGSDPTGDDTNQLIGRPAPEIEATDTDGRPFSVRDYRGQWVLVNFFGTWCTPCIAEHPELVRFSESHRQDGSAAVVSVAYNDEPEAVEQFFASNGGDWAVIADEESDYSIEYAVVALPESYLIDPDGVVVHKFVGGITAAEIDEEIAKRS